MATINEDIMKQLRQSSDLAATVKSRYAQQPAEEERLRAHYFEDPTLKGLMSGYSDKVAELYKYDQARNATYSAPMTTQAGQDMPINPMIGEQANQAYFNQAVTDKEKAWQLYETRKNVLGSILDKAVKAYEAETAGMKAEADLLTSQAQAQIDFLKASGTTSGGYTGIDSASPEELSQIDFNNVPDSEVVAMAKEVYGPNVKLGTQSQAPAYARRLLEQYKNGGYDIQVLSSTMDNSTKDVFKNSIKFIGDAKNVLNSLSSKDIYSSIGEATTGPVASVLGPFMGQKADSKEVKARQLLDQMRAEKIKEFYGGAFTTTEMKNANWLPGANRQESTNIAALNGMVKSAEDKIRGALQMQGITGPAQDKVVEYLVGSSAPVTSATTPSSDGWIEEGGVKYRIKQ